MTSASVLVAHIDFTWDQCGWVYRVTLCTPEGDEVKEVGLFESLEEAQDAAFLAELGL